VRCVCRVCDNSDGFFLYEFDSGKVLLGIAAKYYGAVVQVRVNKRKIESAQGREKSRFFALLIQNNERVSLLHKKLV